MASTARARGGAPVPERRGARRGRPLLGRPRAAPRGAAGACSWPPAAGGSTRSASTRGPSTTACSTGTGCCSATRSATATSGPTGWRRRSRPWSAPAEQYAVNGLAALPFNTVYQLVAARGTAALESAETLLLLPDLLGYWLTGAVGAERTNASTTGLLDVAAGEWATDAGEPPRPAVEHPAAAARARRRAGCAAAGGGRRGGCPRGRAAGRGRGLPRHRLGGRRPSRRPGTIGR